MAIAKKTKNEVIAEAEYIYEMLIKTAEIVFQEGKQLDSVVLNTQAKRKDKLGSLENIENRLKTILNSNNQSVTQDSEQSYLARYNPIGRLKRYIDIQILAYTLNEESKYSNDLISAIEKHLNYLSNQNANDITHALKDKDSAIRKQLDNQIWYLNLLEVIGEERIAEELIKIALEERLKLLHELIQEDIRLAKLQYMLQLIENSRIKSKEYQQDKLKLAVQQLALLESEVNQIKNKYASQRMGYIDDLGDGLEDAFMQQRENLKTEKEKEEFDEFMKNYRENKTEQKERAKNIDSVLKKEDPGVYHNPDSMRGKAQNMAELINFVAMKEFQKKFGKNSEIEKTYKNFDEKIKDSFREEQNELNAKYDEIKEVKKIINSEVSLINSNSNTELQHEQARANTVTKVYKLMEETIKKANTDTIKAEPIVVPEAENSVAPQVEQVNDEATEDANYDELDDLLNNTDDNSISQNEKENYDEFESLLANNDISNQAEEKASVNTITHNNADETAFTFHRPPPYEPKSRELLGNKSSADIIKNKPKF